MKKRITTILIWIVLFAAIAMMVSGMNPSRTKSEELDYNSEFLKLVERTVAGETGKTIKAIQIDYRTISGLYSDSKSTLEDLPKKAEFTVVIPSEATFRQDLAAIIYNASPDKYDGVDQISSADYPFQYKSVLTQESIWSILLPYLILFGGFAIFYYFLIRQQGGGMQMMNFGKSRARVQSGDSNRVTFDDVAGEDEEKEELKEVVEFMRNPGKFNSMGARIPKGVLLVGPPGTGKTLLAKAVAGEANVPFFSISGSDFVEMFVGVGASRVRDLFNTAKHSTPAVIFIDEIDAVGRHRGAGMGGGHDEREQTLNQLLIEMDGFSTNEGIIVLAATNRPDILDPALLRPGRFDRKITVNYPDVKGREAILKVHARNKPLGPDADLSVLAKRTPGFTGADLENVLNEAAILAAREDKDKISMHHLEEAITRVQMGPEKRSRLITDADKRLTAYHESGHAIVALKLPGCDPVHEVSIIPRGQAAGYTMSLPKEDQMMVTKNKLLDQISMALGGRVAEELKFVDVSTGAYSDLQRSSEIARKMVTEYGMSDNIGPIFLGGEEEVFIARDWGHTRNYSENLASMVDEEVQRILETQYEIAKKCIGEDMDALDRVAQMLIDYECVTGEAFKAVYYGASAEDAVKKDKAPKAEKLEPEKIEVSGDSSEAVSDLVQNDETGENDAEETSEAPLTDN